MKRIALVLSLFLLSVSYCSAGTLNNVPDLSLYFLKAGGIIGGDVDVAGAITVGGDLTVGGAFTIGSGASPTNIETTITDSDVALPTSGATKKYVDNKVSYVDRGDPTSFDFTISDFSTDGSWHDLDLSGIIPVDASAVQVSLFIQDDAIGSLFQVRKNGNTNGVNAPAIRTSVTNINAYMTAIVSTDNNRKIEYKGSNVSFIDIQLVISGWFK